MSELNNEESLQNAQEDLLDLNEVMQSFGVTAWTNLGALDATYGRGLHLLVELEGQRYVLRERPEGMVGEELQHRYDFQRYLQRGGIPIPAYRLTPQGEPAVTVGEDAFELQEWVGEALFSTSAPESLDWVGYAGTMLGRLHQLSHTYRGHQHRWPSEAHMGGVVQGYLNLARRKVDESSTQAVSAALSNWIEQWEAVLPAAMMSIGAGGPLPEFHIHGDYHALNLRFGRSEVTAVMGLEASRWEKRLFEVAYALFYFSALSWQPDTTLTRPLVKRGFEPERARHFLHSYGAIYPPARGEAKLLADALSLVAPIATLNGPLEDLFYQPGEDDAPPIDDVLERLTWATTLPAWLRRVRGSLAEMWE